MGMQFGFMPIRQVGTRFQAPTTAAILGGSQLLELSYLLMELGSMGGDVGTQLRHLSSLSERARHRLRPLLLSLERGSLIVLCIGQIGAAPLSISDPALPPEAKRGYESVALAALIATPTPFDGKRVRVEGFVTLEFEGSGLYPVREAYYGGVTQSALRIERPKWLTSNFERSMTKHYASVWGTFKANEPGSGSIYSGTIRDIISIDSSLTTAEYSAERIANVISLWTLPGAAILGCVLVGALALWMSRRRRGAK